MTLLSICIPTYNRAKYLRVLLNSIFEQTNFESVEVVILDNCSTDNTVEIVDKYIGGSFDIKYYRRDKNYGAINNVVKVVDYASGKYCWIIGDDDALNKNAMAIILKNIKSVDADIFLYERVECDKNLNELRRINFIKKNNMKMLYNSANKQELLSYFNSCKSIGGLFSFIGSTVFKRTRWKNIKFDYRFYKNSYPHVFVFLSILKKGCFFYYCKEKTVLCRLNNESFPGSQLERYLIDFNDYYQLSELIQNSSSKLFLDIVKRTHKLPTLTKMYELANSKSEQDLIDKAIKNYNYDYVTILLSKSLARFKVYSYLKWLRHKLIKNAIKG